MHSITKLKKLLGGFLEQKGNSDRLRKLFEISEMRGRSGFEKWLQFELFMYFYHNHPRLNSQLEAGVEVHQGKNSEKKIFRVDLMLHMSPKENLAIELKVRRKSSSALRACRADLQKFHQTKTKHRASSNFSVVLCGECPNDDQIVSLREEHGNCHVVSEGAFPCFIIIEADSC